MSDEQQRTLSAFTKAVATLLDEHGLNDSVKVAIGTRIEGRVYAKAVGSGDVHFLCQETIEDLILRGDGTVSQ